MGPDRTVHSMIESAEKHKKSLKINGIKIYFVSKMQGF